MKKVAIVGTQGVPASYGGFETLVENIIDDNCSARIQYTIFCSSKDMLDKREKHKGCHLKYIPLRANGIQSIPYDIWSLIKAAKGYDAILVLGTSGCCFLPVFRFLFRKRLIVNINGLEHRRAKWGWAARQALRFSESMAVRFANTVVTNSKVIQDYVQETYGKKAALIAYGGDHVYREISDDFQRKCLLFYGLKRDEYAISVCRIEPENNCHLTLEAFARSGKKLVFIGNWKRNEYARELVKKYERCPNIILLDAIYDLDVLCAMRANAGLYVHGHSAGGTNPSLVEAMFFGRPVIAYDVIYNRLTTEDKAHYFSDAEELQQLLSDRNTAFEENASAMYEVANRLYRWDTIAKQYEALY